MLLALIHFPNILIPPSSLTASELRCWHYCHPLRYQAEITSNTKKTVKGLLSPLNIDTSYRMSKANAAVELRHLRAIIADAANCKVECQSKTAWDVRVHDPLPRLAMKRSTLSRMRPRIAATANIIPALRRNVVTGNSLSPRLVDFRITLEPDINAKRRSINQSLYLPLRFQPIAMTVECKTDTATEKVESQLATD